MMTEGKKVVLNGRGITLLVVVVASLVFALGFMTANMRNRAEVTVFTSEELDRIVELREQEEDMFVYKDEQGNLMIGWGKYRGFK